MSTTKEFLSWPNGIVHLPPVSLDMFSSFQLLVLGLTISLVLIALKRRYLSPISDIPGPFIATISGILWHVRETLKGDYEKEVMALHKKHGRDICIGCFPINLNLTCPRFLLALTRVTPSYRPLRPYRL